MSKIAVLLLFMREHCDRCFIVYECDRGFIIIYD